MTTSSGDADVDFTGTPTNITGADSAGRAALNSADEVSELMRDHGISRPPERFTGALVAGARRAAAVQR